MPNKFVSSHRGMGDSKLASGEDKLTLEMLAWDLLVLLKHLGWKELAICGFSMGGVVAQQLLFLPYHPVNPTSLPFQLTHVLLTGTLCSKLTDKRYGLPMQPVPKRPLTDQEKIDLARPTVELTFDPEWVSNPENTERLNWLLSRMISGRPAKVIHEPTGFHGSSRELPRSIQFLVIHGELDAIVPFIADRKFCSRFLGPSRSKSALTRRSRTFALWPYWFEYFDVRVWHDVVEKFLGSATCSFVNGLVRV
ncbi:hypothetical protein B0H10DRAFT_2115510 [Mycena sp. CBHHK59/15]|nr:hypothetical protein B0H10DRAFT_2115510 [Mycena sp. CBHHK59/15]